MNSGARVVIGFVIAPLCLLAIIGPLCAGKAADRIWRRFYWEGLAR